MDPTFVGREAELAHLPAQMEEVRSGRPRVVLLDGPPGIGKSALIRRFVEGAGDIHVLRANGEEVEALVAFGIMDQLARTATGGVGEALLGLLSHQDPTRD